MNLEELYQHVHEEERLQKSPAAHIEFLTTTQYLTQYLHGHERILDLGAATGAYALPLAEAGYEVCAMDLMPHHLNRLKQQKKKQMKLILHQGNAMDLSRFSDDSFDIILCMGPLYHLKEEEQRICLDEMHRVVKDDGIIFCAFLSNLAVFTTEALYPNSSFLNSSQYDPTTFKVINDPFVSTYVQKAEQLFQSMGFTLLKTFSQDGLAEVLAERINALTKPQYEEWLRFHLAICEQREQLAHSNHLISILQSHKTRQRLQDTTRLRLQRLSMQDHVQMYEMAKDPDVARMCGWKPHASLEETKQILSNFLINDHTWGIYQKTDNTLYGLISLDADQHRPRNGYRMLGYWIGKPYWGKGIVVEAAKEVLRYAFEDLHCTIISVYHFPFNTQSKRVIEKLGFQYEGTLHDAYEYYDGTYFDEVCYYLKQEPS